MKRFLFLVCSERSGSNFLTSLMNGHSRVSGPPPTHLFRLFATNRGKYGDLSDDANWEAMAEDVAVNFSSKLGSWTTSITASELRREASGRSVAALLRVIYEREADSDGASHVFVKENQTATFASFLLAHFQDCRFVFLVRDPRDVAKSWVRTVSIPGGVAEAVDVWRRDQENALRLADQLADSGLGLIIRYEDLIAEPTVTLKRLTDHAGLVYEPSMLDFHADRRTRANAERIHAWANLKRPVMRNNAGGYREVLSEEDQRYVELACAPLMDRLGYERELEMQALDGGILDQKLAELRPHLAPGCYEIPTPEEQAIRNLRLAAIRRVLDRGR